MRNINPPKTLKQLGRFLGMINYYREIWRGRSDLLAPLLGFTYNKLNFK